MFGPYGLFFIVLWYLTLLFAVAYYAERKERHGRSLINNPYIFSLSLAVYCSSWTFYGSVGKAATSGVSFLTIYLGPTLMAALWVVILKKVVRLSKAHRITTIADFISSRYGKSLALSCLVTIIAVAGITPYIGLQIKAIMSTFAIISGDSKGGAAAGLFITIILGIFAIIFGARRLDSSERHGGLVFAIAFESIVKLLAFLLIGTFVTYGLFDGFTDITTRIRDSNFSAQFFPGTGGQYSEWTALLLLSMMAVMFLPRQFQMAVVENYDEGHIGKAAWLFPLYLFLMNIFVLPIAFGGVLSEGSQEGADYFVLTLPLDHGARYLALLAFLGGFSAATSMVIVEALALSTMVMNSVIMPFLVSVQEEGELPTIASSIKTFILNVKRAIILFVVFLGYLFAISVGEFYSLVDIGLMSFEAVALFGPSFLLGLYWKRGSKKGAIAGLIAGFAVWFYTLLVPALMRAGFIEGGSIIASIAASDMLNPDALFGISGLDKWGHSLFWSALVNLILYVGISVWTRPSKEEEIQSLIFVESYERAKELALGGSYAVKDIEEILTQYLGRSEAAQVIEPFLSQVGKTREDLSPRELFRLRNEAEKALSAAIGSSMASIILKNTFVLTETEREELSESVKQITGSLRLSRQELTAANRELSYLKEFSENIIESAPVGIVTIDATLRVRYWNREMEVITGLKKPDTANQPVTVLLPWLPMNVIKGTEQREVMLQTPAYQTFKVNVSPFRDLPGGFVVIIEDVTEKKRMEQQLLQSSKLASIGKLTAGISHEIGNPLASISSLVQELTALRMHVREERAFADQSLRTINTHIERIARIVRSLGDFARVSSAEKTFTNISEVLDRTVNLVKYDKRFKKILCITNVSDIPPLKVNPDQFQQVFLNLILNALDAMPDGGRIEVSAARRDSVAEIEFHDTGSGIEESIIDRVFDPFFTTKPLGKGTGLGLSICYGIIREHNGSITVRSTRDEGTTFSITLPIEQ